MKPPLLKWKHLIGGAQAKSTRGADGLIVYYPGSWHYLLSPSKHFPAYRGTKDEEWKKFIPRYFAVCGQCVESISRKSRLCCTLKRVFVFPLILIIQALGVLDSPQSPWHAQEKRRVGLNNDICQQCQEHHMQPSAHHNHGFLSFAWQHKVTCSWNSCLHTMPPLTLSLPLYNISILSQVMHIFCSHDLELSVWKNKARSMSSEALASRHASSLLAGSP